MFKLVMVGNRKSGKRTSVGSENWLKIFTLSDLSRSILMTSSVSMVNLVSFFRINSCKCFIWSFKSWKWMLILSRFFENSSKRKLNSFKNTCMTSYVFGGHHTSQVYKFFVKQTTKNLVHKLKHQDADWLFAKTLVS